MVQVGVDSLEYEIHRLSVFAPRPDQMNIELLPTEGYIENTLSSVKVAFL